MILSPLKHTASKGNWLSSKLAAACSLTAVATSLFGADIAGPASKNSQLKPYPRAPKPESVPASSETENRSRQFKVPAGMKVDLWAAAAILIMAFLLVIPPVFTHQHDRKPAEIRQAVVRNIQNSWMPEVLAPYCFTP